MSECYRIGLSYSDGHHGPRSVVLKVAATDPMSRQTGLALGLYEREVRFYTDIAPGIGGPIAPCYPAAFDADTGAFHLLLGDAGPAVVGDEIRGATVEQAMLGAVRTGSGARAAGRRHRNGGRRVAESGVAVEPGADRAALRRVRRALRQADRAGAPRGLRAPGRRLRRLSRRRGRAGCAASCMATTAWTTCFSVKRVPTGR